MIRPDYDKKPTLEEWFSRLRPETCAYIIQALTTCQMLGEDTPDDLHLIFEKCTDVEVLFDVLTNTSPAGAASAVLRFIDKAKKDIERAEKGLLRTPLSVSLLRGASRTMVNSIVQYRAELNRELRSAIKAIPAARLPDYNGVSFR